MLTNVAFDGAVNLELGRREMSANEEALSDFLTHALSKRGWRKNHKGCSNALLTGRQGKGLTITTKLIVP